MRVAKLFQAANAVNEGPGQIKLLGDLKQLAERDVELNDAFVLVIRCAVFELSEGQLVKLVDDEEVDVGNVVSLVHPLLRQDVDGPIRMALLRAVMNYLVAIAEPRLQPTTRFVGKGHGWNHQHEPFQVTQAEQRVHDGAFSHASRRAEHHILTSLEQIEYVELHRVKNKAVREGGPVQIQHSQLFRRKVGELLLQVEEQARLSHHIF
ncbi:hypothetical protein D9M71_564270 [compost metagenome]